MQYWVIGGEFSSLNFHQLVPGTQDIHGPYPTRQDAEEVWKERSQETRHKANVRYRIVTVDE